MTGQGPDERPGALVRQVKFTDCLAHDPCNLAVMNMTQIGKEVVFDLIIKSTDEPREPSAFIAKVCGRVQLVYRPVVFKAVVRIRKWKFRAFNHMGWLKNNGKNEPGDVMHEEQSQQDLPPKERCQKQGNYVNVCDVERF